MIHPRPGTRFYTYRRQVKLLPGQVARFLRGLGWYAFGKPNPGPHPGRPVTMYDSVNLATIPPDAPAVAGYVGGQWPTFPKIAARWPHARRLSIAVTASEDADCLDIENGDAVPDQAAAWVRRQRLRGIRRPVVYSSVSEMGAVLAALYQAGITRAEVKVWTAHYTGKPHRCTTPTCGYECGGQADATQYDDHALGRNLDASLCHPTFFD